MIITSIHWHCNGVLNLGPAGWMKGNGGYGDRVNAFAGAVWPNNASGSDPLNNALGYSGGIVLKKQFDACTKCVSWGKYASAGIPGRGP